MSGFPRPEHVQTHTRNDGRQPPSEVIDVADIGPAQAQPRFLNRIIGFDGRAEDSKGYRAKMAACFLKLVCQPGEFSHRSHFLLAFRHGYDG
jgi:hypothetical protein